jgi:UDP-2,3-diacylglucosamine hydrolase
MNKKIYFAADFHLGINSSNHTAAEREKIICSWLDHIQKDAKEIYLLGDLFDFWFEYKKVVPKGHTRFFGKLVSIADSGIPIHVFTGNHDLWMFGYFEKELGIPVYHSPIQKEWNGIKFMLGHGDGLGPGDYGYKKAEKGIYQPLSNLAFCPYSPKHWYKIGQLLVFQEPEKICPRQISGTGKRMAYSVL